MEAVQLKHPSDCSVVSIPKWSVHRLGRVECFERGAGLPCFVILGYTVVRYNITLRCASFAAEVVQSRGQLDLCKECKSPIPISGLRPRQPLSHPESALLHQQCCRAIDQIAFKISPRVQHMSLQAISRQRLGGYDGMCTESQGFHIRGVSNFPPRSQVGSSLETLVIYTEKTARRGLKFWSQVLTSTADPAC